MLGAIAGDSVLTIAVAGAIRRAKYQAIGESDRFALKFVKQ